MKITEEQFLKLKRIANVLTTEFKNLEGVELLGKTVFSNDFDKSTLTYSQVNPKHTHVAVVTFRKNKKEVLKIAISDPKKAENALMLCLLFLQDKYFMNNGKLFNAVGAIKFRLHELLNAECGFAYIVRFAYTHDGDFDYGVSRTPANTRKGAAAYAAKLVNDLVKHYNLGDSEKVSIKDCEKPVSIQLSDDASVQTEVYGYAVFPKKYGI